jgi:L-seryl-tRNA(Ser) seleniumtransferase
MSSNDSIYDELDVPTVLNAVGSHTRISGSLMRREAAEEMVRATEEFVHIGTLQGRASELISEATGAEAGLVTNGAAAGLTLAAAACIAGDDYTIMNRLPETNGVPDEIVIPRAHRNQYDVAFRASGAQLVGVGLNELHPFEDGSESVEPWELDGAITADTVAVAYVDRPHNLLWLPQVVEIAHTNDVPVIVDAAAELPPSSNLTRYIDDGADLVVFSGGKAIRGPQSSGMLAGRCDLVQSAALQMFPTGVDESTWEPPEQLIDSDALPGMPRHGIGRGMKVGKEEIVGFVTALQLFLDEDDDEIMHQWYTRAKHMAGGLADVDAFDVTLTNTDDPATVSTVIVSVDAERSGPSALELVRTLREENPQVFVGEGHVDRGVFTINAQHLTDDQADYVVDPIASRYR